MGKKFDEAMKCISESIEETERDLARFAGAVRWLRDTQGALAGVLARKEYMHAGSVKLHGHGDSVPRLHIHCDCCGRELAKILGGTYTREYSSGSPDYYDFRGKLQLPDCPVLEVIIFKAERRAAPEPVIF